MLNRDAKVREVYIVKYTSWSIYLLSELQILFSESLKSNLWKTDVDLYFCQMLTDIRENTALFNGSQASSARHGKMIWI